MTDDDVHDGVDFPATTADSSGAAHPSNGVRPGERRGGRAIGTPNKVTADVKALAQEHGPAAVALLAKIITNPAIK